MLNNLRQYFRIKRQSLIFRLLFYFILSMFIVALILSINFTSRIKPQLKNDLLPNLARYIEYVVDDIGLPPNLNKASSLAFELPFEIRIEGPDTDWSSQSVIKTIDKFDLEQAPRPYEKYYIGHDHDEFVLMVEKQAYRYLFVVDNSFRSGSRNRHWVLFVSLAGTLFILFVFIRRMFRPIATISQQVRNIGAGKLDNPIEIHGEDELAKLAQGINDMSLQIKTMLESKASLLLAISHELRSPMTRMRVNLELIDESGTRDTLIDDVREMELLVSNILESEKLNTSHAPLNRSELNMAETIEGVIKEYFPDENINTNLSPVVASLDEVRIRLLIKNLLDNACRYLVETATPVEIKLERQADFLSLQISDHGPGISETDLTRIAEPFYRADTARQRSTGGYGLGLYLCKLIVEAHTGTINFQSIIGEGTTVTVRLPVNSTGRQN
jgi:signal transduction histidine kinase